MPIVVYHTPAGLAGDLASNAGNFATGMALSDQNLQYQHFAAQQQQQAAARQQQADQFAAEEQLRRDQMAQQDRWHQDSTAHEDQQFNHHLQLMDHQYELQGKNQHDLADLNNQARLSIADENNVTRAGIAGDQLDARKYVADEQSQTRQDELEARKQHWADQATGGGAAGLAFKQQVETRIATNQQLAREFQMRKTEVQTLQRQIRDITTTLTGTFGMDPTQRSALVAEQARLRKQLGTRMGEFQNRYMSVGQSDPMDPGNGEMFNPSQQPAQVQGAAAYGPTTQPAAAAPSPGYAAPYAAPATQPAATQPAATQPAAPPMLTPQQQAQIAQMKAQGYTREQIRAALRL